MKEKNGIRKIIESINWTMFRNIVIALIVLIAFVGAIYSSGVSHGKVAGWDLANKRITADYNYMEQKMGEYLRGSSCDSRCLSEIDLAIQEFKRDWEYDWTHPEGYRSQLGDSPSLLPFPGS